MKNINNAQQSMHLKVEQLKKINVKLIILFGHLRMFSEPKIEPTTLNDHNDVDKSTSNLIRIFPNKMKRRKKNICESFFEYTQLSFFQHSNSFLEYFGRKFIFLNRSRLFVWPFRELGFMCYIFCICFYYIWFGFFWLFHMIPHLEPEQENSLFHSNESLSYSIKSFFFSSIK